MEMTKTKRQLRAEAVGRLKKVRYHNAVNILDALLGRMGVGREKDTLELIDLLTDEQTNVTDGATNVIRSDAPLAEEPPEGDVLEELKFYADENRYDYNPLKDTFEVDERLAELCGHAADMVERDYVRQEKYEAWKKLVKQWEDLYEEVLAERDEWKVKAEKHASEMQGLHKALELERGRKARWLPDGVEWPRFEDGAYVELHDRVTFCNGAELRANRIEFNAVGEYRIHYGAVADDYRRAGTPVKRPPLKASDGEPIEVGETLYGLSDGKAWTVTGLLHGESHPVEAHHEDQKRGVLECKHLKARWLTHGRPDSLQDVALTIRRWLDVEPDERSVTIMKYALENTAERIEKLAKEVS